MATRLTPETLILSLKIKDIRRERWPCGSLCFLSSASLPHLRSCFTRRRFTVATDPQAGRGWLAHGRFLYCLDWVCIAAAVLYATNRWLIKPSQFGRTGFFHDYFNDVLCIPLFLPAVLLVHRLLRVRPHDGVPTAFEIIFHWVLWSVCFELIAPRFQNLFRTTADPLDVVAYGFGAGIGMLIWHVFPGKGTMRRAGPKARYCQELGMASDQADASLIPSG